MGRGCVFEPRCASCMLSCVKTMHGFFVFRGLATPFCRGPGPAPAADDLRETIHYAYEVIIVLPCSLVFCMYNDDTKCVAVDRVLRFGMNAFGACHAYLPMYRHIAETEAKKKSQREEALEMAADQVRWRREDEANRKMSKETLAEMADCKLERMLRTAPARKPKSPKSKEKQSPPTDS